MAYGTYKPGRAKATDAASLLPSDASHFGPAICHSQPSALSRRRPPDATDGQVLNSLVCTAIGADHQDVVVGVADGRVRAETLAITKRDAG